MCVVMPVWARMPCWHSQIQGDRNGIIPFIPILCLCSKVISCLMCVTALGCYIKTKLASPVTRTDCHLGGHHHNWTETQESEHDNKYSEVWNQLNSQLSYMKHSQKVEIFCNSSQWALADLEGARPVHASPLRVKILSFWNTKFLKRNCLGNPRPPTKSTPPQGKSWIRHCLLCVFHCNQNEGSQICSSSWN